jgi:hypothetical protein
LTSLRNWDTSAVEVVGSSVDDFLLKSFGRNLRTYLSWGLFAQFTYIGHNL